MKKKSEKDSKGVYGLEITTTQACNFRCTYCFERCHEVEEKTLNASIVEDKVLELLDADWFNEQYSGVKIILWGGEPTLNTSLCRNLMNAFMHNERVCFFIYTNGSMIDNLIDVFRDLKNRRFIKDGISKITIQVSYDGNQLHDTFRLDSNGRPTSTIALEAIDTLHHYGIDYGLKATMPWEAYHLLPQSWDDFEGLFDCYGPKIKYALTVDYYDVKFKRFEKAVREALIRVAQKEVKFWKENGFFLSNIFKNNMSLCATGKSMACVDVDGETYNCHGAIYSRCSNRLKYTNIFDKNFINSLRDANIVYKDNLVEHEVCKNCIATSCLRCNVKKYEESHEETHLKRWFDYPAQKELCEYYQLVGKIASAIGSIIKE